MTFLKVILLNFFRKIRTFVFTKASFSHNATSVTVNVTAQDKMCLLNGTCGGTIPDFVVFHEIEMTLKEVVSKLETS